MNKTFLCVLLCLSFVFESQAQQDHNNVEISLITISPGEFYWSAFGHTALRVKSLQSDIMFGFGYFDFTEENFFINFAKGEMQYFLGVLNSIDELDSYRQEGRKVTSQRLDLTSHQKQQIIEKLLFLSREENKYYAYDYFLNNCTSQIRDIINQVTDGELNNNLSVIHAQKSWNDLTFPATNQTWMNLGIAIVYGLPAFTKRDQWQLSVFPEVFSDDVNKLKTVSNWNNNLQVLYSPTENQSKFSQHNFWQTHYAVILCAVLLIIGLLIKPLSPVIINLWLVSQSFLGIALVVLVFFTSHSIALWNINVLIFFPLAFLLVFKKLRRPKVIQVFLILNILWVILAGIMTNYYLIGFCVINLLIGYKLITQVHTERL
jgi:hypothetical protein